MPSPLPGLHPRCACQAGGSRKTWSGKGLVGLSHPPFYPDGRLAPGMAAEQWEGRSQGAGGSWGQKLPEALRPHMPDLGGSGLCSRPTRAGGVCAHAPSTHCCPPFRPSVTVTVPFAVTASCVKAIKPACAQMLWPLCVSAPRALCVPAGIHCGPPLRDWGHDVLSPSCRGTQSPVSLSHQTQHWECQLGVGGRV